MKRRLIIGLLSVSLCFVGITPVFTAQLIKTFNSPAEYEKITGRKIEKFHEAPMLRVKVAAGELPPVEQRLPEEPLVVQPYEEIGQYGGTIHGIATSPDQWDDTIFTHIPTVFYWSNDCTEIFPNYGASYEFSKDKKTITIRLRKGIKWSDGHPMTAEDILFWWEDEILNDELTPVKTFHELAGKLPEVEKVDDYTIRLHYAAPCGARLGHFICIFAFRPDPKHYLKKWHIKYNPRADEIAKEEGYDHWWQAFNYHVNHWASQQDVNLPVLGAWVLKERTTTRKIYERNPYYWKIDTAGNQLPYADKLITDIVSDMEVVNMKAMAGEVDFVGMPLLLENYPLFKENAKKGNYRVFLWNTTNGSECSFLPNLNHKDPVLRNIFQDVRFRQAMSLAINRDEINELVFMGTGIPRQVTVFPNASYYKEQWGKAYAQYDPAKANQLLDEMGLKWDSEHKFRLRPDGKTLAITIEFWAGEAPLTAICELVKEYWEKIGIKVALKSEERTFYEQRTAAGEHDVGVWETDRCMEGRIFSQPPKGWFSAPQWATWFNTKGETGEEPPEVLKKYVRLIDEWQTTLMGSKEYKQLAQKVFDTFAENIWIIGTVGLAKRPIVVKNYLRNLPEKAYFGCDNDWWAGFLAEQWFLKKR